MQGSHRLEKYLNLDGLLEKSLEIISALNSTGKSLKGLEKSLNPAVGQYKISVRLFVVENAQQFYTHFPVLSSP